MVVSALSVFVESHRGVRVVTLVVVLSFFLLFFLFAPLFASLPAFGLMPVSPSSSFSCWFCHVQYSSYLLRVVSSVRQVRVSVPRQHVCMTFFLHPFLSDLLASRILQNTYRLFRIHLVFSLFFPTRYYFSSIFCGLACCVVLSNQVR